MKRICQIIIALSLPLLFCGPVRAEHAGPYVGGFIGGNLLTNSKATDSQGDFGLTFNPALQESAVAGWDFAQDDPVGEGRIELEYTRHSNTLDQVKFAEGSIGGGGSLTSNSLLLNFFGVFHENRTWAPYIGVGFGAARMTVSDFTVTDGSLGSGSSYVFAYQAGAGLDFALTDYLNLDLGYRFFGSTRPQFTEVNGLKCTFEYYSQSVVLGLRVGF